MIKRIAAAALALMMLMAFGCKKATEAEQMAEQPQEVSVYDTSATTPAPYELSEKLCMIIDDDGSIGAYMAMYGFLHTAEIMGYPAKLYRAKAGAESEAAVRTAADEGFGALLIFDQAGANDAAVSLAVSCGMKVVVPYYECAVPGIASNVVADTSEYVEEVCRGLAARMSERSLKSGRILLYGNDTSVCYDSFVAAVTQYHPQYGVVSFNRTAADDEAAIDELAQFILYNRDIKGMYVVDNGLAPIAVSARSRAQSIFRSEGAPTPTPPQTLPEGTPGAEDPLATPQPTPNPGLLTAITITVFASGLSDDNYKLFNDNDIYGLCIEPYYETCTQATMYLDKLLKGDEVPASARVNRPIAYADTIEKYTVIFGTVKEMFGL